MSSAILRVLLRSTSKAQLRALSTSSIRCGSVVVDQAFKDTHYPRIGDRDIVGYGTSGEPDYHDMDDEPFPPIRFGRNTAEIMALREKEKGDWKALTLEERKRLYRHSFRQTLSEKYAPTGEWKIYINWCLATFSASFIIYLFFHYYVYPEPQKTLTSEWARASAKRMLRQQQGDIEGISSEYDFEKGDWKKKK